jgi:hypothetical protein
VNGNQLKRLITCKLQLSNFLDKLQAIENDKQANITEKLSQIKIIREEIKKVGMEIDSIKKEIILEDTYKVN